MSRQLRFQSVVIVLFLLSSCNFDARRGVHTPKPEPNGEGFFYPVGIPAREWNNIPIMPQATFGQAYSELSTYSFKANTTVKEVQDFYNARLAEQGWYSLFTVPSNSDGAVLVFQKESTVLTITAMYVGRPIIVILNIA